MRTGVDVIFSKTSSRPAFAGTAIHRTAVMLTLLAGWPCSPGAKRRKKAKAESS